MTALWLFKLIWAAALASAGVLLAARAPYSPGTLPIRHALPIMTLRTGALIVCEGDSLTYGLVKGPARDSLPPINGASQLRATPYPETLARALKGRAKVINRGFPGDRTSDGAARWRQAPAGDLAILMYGTNDSDARLRDGRYDLALFRQTYAQLVERKLRADAQVILLLPPTRSLDDRTLDAYRTATVEVGRRYDVRVLDSRDLLGADHAATSDGTHLNARGYAALGRALAAMISFRRASP